jgi:8-amino-3,8-dideoxy-alpha-D-manno-octulosonate transaminase
MPGWELINHKEKNKLLEIFNKSNGVMFAHGFDKRRKKIFRVREFEKRVCKFLKVKYCLATTSGTMAQYIAMKALGIKKGDEVITQAFTFVATVEAILALGAKPVIVDIDESLNMSTKDLSKNITSKTKLIIPVPMLGNPCNMKKILKISNKKKIPILEDACESLGSQYHGKYVGTLGDVGVFSLDFGKIITTGEGGLIVSNNKKIMDYCREFHDHGHQNNIKKPRGEDTRKIWGLNLRMTELQASIGLAQLDKLNFIIKKNKKNKIYLKKRIKKNDLFNFRLINSKDEISDTLILTLNDRKKALELTKILEKNKIGTKNLPDSINWHFAGNWEHIFKYVNKYKKNYKTRWNKSRDLLERSIALPIFVKTNKKELNFLAQLINNFFNKHLIR